MDAPEGFAPLGRRGGPYLTALGPLFVKQHGEQWILGLRVEASHLNSKGIAHGGMLITFADSALGIRLAELRNPPQPMVTASLTTDFLETASEGDWLEAQVQLDKMGARLAFATCYLRVSERPILRASGVFAVVAPPGS